MRKDGCPCFMWQLWSVSAVGSRNYHDTDSAWNLRFCGFLLSQGLEKDTYDFSGSSSVWNVSIVLFEVRENDDIHVGCLGRISELHRGKSGRYSLCIVCSGITLLFFPWKEERNKLFWPSVLVGLFFFNPFFISILAPGF